MKGEGTNIFRRWVIVPCLVFLCSPIFSSPLFSKTYTDCGAYDTPSDGGGSITIYWNDSANLIPAHVDTLTVYRRAVGESDWDRLAETATREKLFLDNNTIDGTAYEYRLEAKDSVSGAQLRVGSVTSSPQWFNANRTVVFVGVLVCLAMLAGVMFIQRSGKSFYVRPIRGLEAVDEAVGRATEMGKSVLFTPGWGGDIQRPTTIAALNILRYVATKTAEHRCDLYFPTHDPVIMAAAEEVIHEAYIEQGQADIYNADNVFYTTSSQLGYAAAVDGLITRYNPAAVFLLGTFEGEALILAETGNSVGAMQVAGTDSTIQLSFFMVACDYTLIGEELFAAVTLAVVGAIMATFGSSVLSDWLGQT
jgi:hypothetical protein